MKVGDIIHVIEDDIEHALPAIVTAVRGSRVDVVKFGAAGAQVVSDIETAASAAEAADRENASTSQVAVPVDASGEDADTEDKPPAKPAKKTAAAAK